MLKKPIVRCVDNLAYSSPTFAAWDFALGGDPNIGDRQACDSAFQTGVVTNIPKAVAFATLLILRAQSRFDALEQPLPQGRVRRRPKEKADVDDRQVGLHRRRQRRRGHAC
jgi:hypothetical protein